MSLQILPLAVHNHLQNYVWLLVNEQRKEAIAIDPNSADVVTQHLQAQQLTLAAIWITHDHHDHVAGVAALKAEYPHCVLYAHQQHHIPNRSVEKREKSEKPQAVQPDITLDEGSQFEAWGNSVQVWGLEGHKTYHLGYLLTDGAAQQHVFCGDVLFSAGCGRVFSGTVEQLYASVQRLASLADDVLFYPTHEFTLNNLNFALQLLPNDAALQQAKADVQNLYDANLPSLPSTLANEKNINVFLRTDEAAVVAAVQEKCGKQITEPAAVFAELRKLKDVF